MKTIPAAKFKAHCLKLMDEVQATREAIIITKRGKP
jgi:prevent-host-death family protein